MQRFYQLADSAPVLMWQNDATGMVFLNEEYVRFCGCARDALLGMGWTGLLHPDSGDYLRAYEQAWASQSRFDAEVRMRRHDGQYRWLHSVGLPHFQDGAFAGYIGCSFDITDTRSAADRLRRQQEWFTDVANTIPTIIWVSDAAGATTFVSRQWYQATGQSDDQGLGWGWLDATHPDDRHRAQEAFRRAQEDRAGFRFECRLRAADGSYRWVIDAGEPRFTPDGEFRGHAGTIFDITDRKLAEGLREVALRELRAAALRKDEFIAALAHELRNPLSPIATGGEILKRTSGDTQQVLKVGEVIGRQVAHMRRLLDELLDVARITREKMDLQRVRIDLVQLVQQVVADHRLAAAQGGIRFDADLPGQPLLVDADAVRIAQGLSNYMHNAAKFARSHAVVRLRSDGAMAIVEVEDDGPGLPPDLLAKLFQPFEQGRQDLARSMGGLGLGLAITKGIVELHGGRVGASSRAEGAGAQFFFELPLAT
ncbi:sensor histidine kinase [Ramlibacter algicola]|uniref:histidine kinase n=1 Tax=Ramlibacter algicola TaxID=2795217 RepID=A0A934Q025_9BURK|nr:PAS domain-containing sensor histidine kinase [Ramlibacter algicola]MBK0392238.1 PAS domain-containing sensor histidine kinase [Ramlibacter algicola]